MRTLIVALVVTFMPACGFAIGDIQEAIDDALLDLPKTIGNIDPKTKVIAVYPLKTDEETAGDSGIIQDKIVKKLIETGRFKVIDRESLELLLKEQALSLTGLTEQRGDMLKVGRLINADAFVFGAASVTGENLTLTLKMVDVATSAIVWQEEFTGESRTRGRFGIGFIWAFSRVKADATFSYEGTLQEGERSRQVNIVAPGNSFDKMKLGSGLAITYRQPFRYSRLLGFGFDLTGVYTFLGGQTKLEAAGVDSVSGETTRSGVSLSGGHVFLSAGAVLFARGKRLFGGKIDRINPYVGVGAATQQLMVKHSEVMFPDDGYRVKDPVADVGSVFARLGAEVLFTRHLAGDLEVNIPVWTMVNTVAHEIEVAVDPVTCPVVRFVLRYVL